MLGWKWLTMLMPSRLMFLTWKLTTLYSLPVKSLNPSYRTLFLRSIRTPLLNRIQNDCTRMFSHFQLSRLRSRFPLLGVLPEWTRPRVFCQIVSRWIAKGLEMGENGNERGSPHETEIGSVAERVRRGQVPPKRVEVSLPPGFSSRRFGAGGPDRDSV